MFPFIVADIGGTNARFALVTEGLKGPEGVARDLEFERVEFLKGADFASFEDAFQAYLQRLDGEKPTGACVAIAGPISGDHVAMTNLPWSFSQRDIADKFGLDHFEAINDYTALALSTSQLSAAGLESVVEGKRENFGNKTVFGPGSGLGVAGLVHGNGKWVPVPSEGGHVNVPVSAPLEIEILAYLAKKHGHVSAEMCLSGPGLENIYEAVASIHGTAPQKRNAKDISSLALSGDDQTSHEALSAFCAILGSLAGNLVLTYGAKGGAYIAGGIVPRFVEFLRNSEFEARFRDKGVMSKYLNNVPVDVIVHDKPAFLGAAAWVIQKYQS